MNPLPLIGIIVGILVLRPVKRTRFVDHGSTLPTYTLCESRKTPSTIARNPTCREATRPSLKSGSPFLYPRRYYSLNFLKGKLSRGLLYGLYRGETGNLD